MNREPIILGLAPALVTGAIAALANVLRAFGFGDITQEQIDALNAAALAIMLLLAALGTWFARNRATPTADPRLVDGTSVTVTNSAGATTGTTTVTPDAPAA